MDKKAVSPVVATVLLIAIVIILALIIFLWAFKGFIPEAIQKRGQPIDQACNEVSLEVSYLKNLGELEVINIGNIPVYRLDIRKIEKGRVDKEEYEGGVSVGQSITVDIGTETEYDEVEVIPVILGETETSKKIHPCKNKFTAEKV